MSDPESHADTATKYTDTTPVMIVSPGFHDDLMVLIREFARDMDSYSPLHIYNGDVEISLTDKPSQIQKTTRLGLERHFRGMRGKSVGAKNAPTPLKIPGHQDRLRNKRKSYLKRLI